MSVQMVVKNGTIVLGASMVRGHLIVSGGRVTDVLLRDGEVPDATTVIDAEGLHVLPGLIDDHVHFRVPGLEYKEDFSTGSRAAICGGITTVMDMPNVDPVTRDVESFERRRDAVRGTAFCDYGFYAALMAGSGPHVQPLAAAGVCGFKVFMGETVGKVPAPCDGELIGLWRELADTGLRSGVHAESNAILSYFGDLMRREGRTDPLAFGESRPAIAEVEAMQRAILIAREAGSKLMIHHISSGAGVEVLRRAKHDGHVDVVGETCPHYLWFDAQDMVRMGLGSLLRINPPIRSAADGAALLGGLLDGTIDVVASDHSPHTAEEKRYDDRMGDIWKAASGSLGVETAVPTMLTAVNDGQLTLARYVQLQSENPARAWGLWPRKGTLDVGADADVTIVDMRRTAVIDEQRLHSKHKVSPWHGRSVKGVPAYTVVRGQLVAKDGEVVATEAGGELVRPRL